MKNNKLPGIDRASVEDYRQEFPIVKTGIYLDHAGVAPIPVRVIREVDKFLGEAAEKTLINY